MTRQAAYAFLESIIWPDGPTCPHCGGVERIDKMGGKSTRIGIHKCDQCRKPFTVKVGTVFEASHVRCTSGCRRPSSCAPARRASARTSSTAR